VGLVGVADVEAAGAALAGLVRPTAVDAPGFLEEIAGRPVMLKHEERQRSGSFKIRGAYWRMAGIDAARRDAGVVAASAGNHGQGVAVSASRLGIAATVFMPAAAPLPKVQATRRYGASVRLVEGPLADAFGAAREHAAATGATLIEPFDDPAVIAGQGTIGLEIVDAAGSRLDPGDEATVAVPVGGGGLISGIAVAVAARRPSWRVIGVEAEGAASARAALDSGGPVTLDSVETMADGIAVARIGDRPYRHIAELVDDVVTVTDDEIARRSCSCSSGASRSSSRRVRRRSPPWWRAAPEAAPAPRCSPSSPAATSTRPSSGASSPTGSTPPAGSSPPASRCPTVPAPSGPSSTCWRPGASTSSTWSTTAAAPTCRWSTSRSGSRSRPATPTTATRCYASWPSAGSGPGRHEATPPRPDPPV